MALLASSESLTWGSAIESRSFLGPPRFTCSGVGERVEELTWPSARFFDFRTVSARPAVSKRPPSRTRDASEASLFSDLYWDVVKPQKSEQKPMDLHALSASTPLAPRARAACACEPARRREPARLCELWRSRAAEL